MKNSPGKKWGVLISGNGSNLQALIDLLPGQISVVISSKEKAYGLIRAKRAGIPVEVFPIEIAGKEKKKDQELWILKTLKSHGVKNVFLAGYMKVVSEFFISEFKKQSGGEIYNIHPSLLPKYKGLNAFESALAEKEDVYGVSVHKVVADVDSGEIIQQEKFKLHGSTGELSSHKLFLHIHEQNLLKKVFKGGAL